MVNAMRAAIVKYSLTLPSTALTYIEQVLLENEIPQEEWATGLDLWAREYLKSEESSSLVSLSALKRAYEILQLNIADDDELADPTEVNVEAHFAVIDSFDMPPVHFDAVRGGFVTGKSKSIAGQAPSRSAYLRERWAYVKEIILRNENFTPPAIGGHDRSNYLKLTSTRNLLGRANELFLLFGMLSRDPEGRLCLEDADGRVVLDMEDAGLFTEGCMVLIEGEYTMDETIRVLAMGHPPSERRDTARGLHGHVDFLGTGAISLKEEAKYEPAVLANAHVSFVILSDVWLDHPRTLPALRRVFQGYSEAADHPPMVFVLCGNFCQKGWESEDGVRRYTNAAGFNGLADVIADFPLLQQSHFVFVPGPLDPWSSSALPRAALPASLTAAVRKRVTRAHFVSDPCRLKYFGQEVVIYREDLMGRMLRNLVGVKDAEDADMKRYTVLDQTHLSPLPQGVRPTLWELDHALRLYPMPTAVVLADKYERFELTYEGCHVFNPGRFVASGAGEFEWAVYYPATGRSERR